MAPNKFWERPNNLFEATAWGLLIPIVLPAKCTHTGCKKQKCSYQKYRTPTKAELSVPGAKPYAVVHCRLTFGGTLQVPFIIVSETGLANDKWYQFMGVKDGITTYAPHSMAEAWPPPSEVHGIDEALRVIPWGKLL